MITSAFKEIKTVFRFLLYALLVYMALHLWRDPSGSADATVDFVNSVGSFFSSLLDRLSAFFRGLGPDGEQK